MSYTVIKAEGSRGLQNNSSRNAIPFCRGKVVAVTGYYAALCFGNMVCTKKHYAIYGKVETYRKQEGFYTVLGDMLRSRDYGLYGSAGGTLAEADIFRKHLTRARDMTMIFVPRRISAVALAEDIECDRLGGIADYPAARTGNAGVIEAFREVYNELSMQSRELGMYGASI